MTTNFAVGTNDRESIPIFRSAPAQPGPLLVIVPSIFGIGPDVIQYAELFSQTGALVYALDSFWRVDSGPLPIPQGSRRAMQRMQMVDPKNVLSDVLSAIEYGQSDELCNGSVLVLGICFGGAFAVQAASRLKLDGLATWHGGNLLSVLDSDALEDTHVQMDFGKVDPLIPMTDVRTIQSALQDLKNAHIRVHEASGHGFTHTGTAKYNPQAASAAQQGVLDLIQICLSL